jgi:hypothetical protein
VELLGKCKKKDSDVTLSAVQGYEKCDGSFDRDIRCRSEKESGLHAEVQVRDTEVI